MLQGRFYPDGLRRATHGEITDLPAIRLACLVERMRWAGRQARGARPDHAPVVPQELASYLSKYKLLSSQRLRYHPREGRERNPFWHDDLEPRPPKVTGAFWHRQGGHRVNIHVLYTLDVSHIIVDLVLK